MKKKVFSFKGRKHLEKSKEAQSKNAIRFFKGKNFSSEHRGKIARSRRRKKISFKDIRYNIYEQFVAFRENKCKFCKTIGILKKEKRKEGNLEIIHLDRKIMNLSPANLVIICSPCVVEKADEIRGLRERYNKSLRKNNI